METKIKTIATMQRNEEILRRSNLPEEDDYARILLQKDVKEMQNKPRGSNSSNNSKILHKGFLILINTYLLFWLRETVKGIITLCMRCIRYDT